MKLLEIEYKGEVYVFETTNKARAEIKDLTMQNVKDFSAGDYLELQIQLKELEKEGAKIDALPDGEQKDELANIANQKLTDLTDKMQAMYFSLEQVDLSALDTMYIILKNTRRFKGNLSRETFYDMIYELEEQKGDVEVFKMMEEAKQKAFTVFKKMTEIEDKAKKPQQKIKSKVSKVS